MGSHSISILWTVHSFISISFEVSKEIARGYICKSLVVVCDHLCCRISTVLSVVVVRIISKIVVGRWTSIKRILLVVKSSTLCWMCCVLHFLEMLILSYTRHPPSTAFKMIRVAALHSHFHVSPHFKYYSCISVALQWISPKKWYWACS